ncbi:hypothetical protein BSZ19_03965 [Bradyrhizobium japonicum]|uniref:Uncharacterized protein n=1 Tax=Bradyrhizobium japonicum TaxID=375 RepID=A0A1Y2JWI5_BRAJP|nr:hypothetical protein BSZ19_03965 [Bradyrhizobium japonicum]
MPLRTRKNRRRRSSVHVTPEAIALFQRGLQERDPHKFRDLKIALAAALSRSKFAACSLDRQPRSLICCDREPVGVVLEIRARLQREIGDHLCSITG